MRNFLVALVLAATALVIPSAAAARWGPAIPGVPPGGFATINVEGVRHGQRDVPPTVRVRIRSSKEPAAIVVTLDGIYVAPSGRPVFTDKHADIPQWEFVETWVYEVELKDLALGVHRLEIRRGVAGSSLPLVNEHDIWFAVGAP
jgi:hypothetical protein